MYVLKGIKTYTQKREKKGMNTDERVIELVFAFGRFSR